MSSVEALPAVRNLPQAKREISGAFSDLCIGDAIDRLNTLVGHYSSETRRIEGIFVTLLLPAAIALYVPGPGGGLPIEWRVSLLAFFAIYAALIFVDLVAAERRFMAAHVLRRQLFTFRGDAEVTNLGTAQTKLDDPGFTARYTHVHITAEERYLTLAWLKPLVAAMVASAVWAFTRGFEA